MLHHKCQHTFSFDPPIIHPHTRIQWYIRLYEGLCAYVCVCALCNMLECTHLCAAWVACNVLCIGSMYVCSMRRHTCISTYCMYVCVYIRTFNTYLCVHTFICMYVHEVQMLCMPCLCYACTYVCIHTYIHAYAYVRTYVCIRMYVRMYCKCSVYIPTPSSP